MKKVLLLLAVLVVGCGSGSASTVETTTMVTCTNHVPYGVWAVQAYPGLTEAQIAASVTAYRPFNFNGKPVQVDETFYDNMTVPIDIADGFAAVACDVGETIAFVLRE